MNYVVCGQSIFSVQGPPPPRYPITSDNPSCPTRFATAAEFLGQPGRTLEDGGTVIQIQGPDVAGINRIK